LAQAKRSINTINHSVRYQSHVVSTIGFGIPCWQMFG
jgi:hypothetical protein